MTNRTLKICSKGHQFHKSSDSPNCPICENLRKTIIGFLSLISAPARRALESKDIGTLTDLAKFTAAEIAQLHGMGPNAMGKLKIALEEEELSFKE